jgi:hypothetical protein
MRIRLSTRVQAQVPLGVVARNYGSVRVMGDIYSIWRGEPWPRKVPLLDDDFFRQPDSRRCGTLSRLNRQNGLPTLEPSSRDRRVNVPEPFLFKTPIRRVAA